MLNIFIEKLARTKSERQMKVAQESLAKAAGRGSASYWTHHLVSNRVYSTSKDSLDLFIGETGSTPALSS